MARLILVRHGETEWNRQKRYQGQTDIELSDAGIEQVKKAANRLAEEKIDSIYCSDLKRAQRTAEIIASKHGLIESVQTSSLLREMNFGDLEGLTFDQMDKPFQLIFSADPSWTSSGPHVRVPNGESIADMAKRVDQFIKKSLDNPITSKTVLIVAHGGPLQVMICHLLGIELSHWWQFRLSAASLSIIETYPQGNSVILLNGISHLQ